MARLVVLSEGYTGKTYELKVDRTTIGRVEDNSFCIPDGSMSSHHAEIILRGEEIILKDLDSTNGTFLDGEPVQEAPVAPGQMIRFGEIDVRLESGDPAAAAAKGEKLDQTKVIPKPQQGVRSDLIGQGGGTKTSQFFKPKKNKANKVFLGIIIALSVAVVALLIVAVVLMSGK